MIVNQWVPAAHNGDAIGDSARRVRDLLRELGHESEIYALTVDEDLRDEVRPFSDASARSGDVTVFHFAVPSPMTDAFASLPGRRVLQYHNVTPAHFFARYDPGMFRIAALGREELNRLVGRTDVALGDSEFNRQELESLGFANTACFPSPSTPSESAVAAAACVRAGALRRVAEFPVRRPHRAQQEDRGSHQARRALQTVR